MATEQHVVRTTCPYCGVGCGVQVARDGEGFKVIGDTQHPANLGRLCSKGAALADTLGLEDRLLSPRLHGQDVSWDTALDNVAQTFRRIIDTHGPDAVAFYVSGQLLTEDYYVANKLMKGFIGSGNIDTNSRLCMSSAVAAHKRAFGSDTVPGCYEDLEQADLIVLAGSNTAWAHPVVYQRIVAAKKARPEMKVVVIDPRHTTTCDIADLHLAVAPGSDAWLFNGLLNYLKREDAIDWSYLEAHVENFSSALNAVSGLSIPQIAQHCGIPEADIATFYRWFTQTPKTVTVFSQGINQSSSGVDKGNAIINLHLATGRIGKPGAAPFSITGQPNAMGGREVGGLANQLAAHMDFAPEQIDRVSRFWNATNIATQPGLKAVDLFEAVHDGRIKAIWIIATNPAVSLPDADRVAEALKKCEYVVVSDNTAKTDTAQLADVLLPAAAWGEKDGTVTNSERRISRQRAFLPLPGEAQPDWWMVCEVAKRMGYTGFNYTQPSEIFREHAALSAFENSGQRDFNLTALTDLTQSQYDALAPVQWPVTNTSNSARMFADGRFYTPSGKAHMLAIVPRAPATPTSASAPFVFNTGRIRDQWHTMTRTGKAPKLLAHIAEPYVEIHPDDARKIGVQNGQLVRVFNDQGELIARVVESTDQQRGSIFSPIHWSSQFARKARVSALIPSIMDPVSGQPEFKHAAVNVEAYATAWHGFAMTRKALTPRSETIWSRAQGKYCWRYEIAGQEDDCGWPGRIRVALSNSELGKHELGSSELGNKGDWIEFKDCAVRRYRAALIQQGKLQAIFFFDQDYSKLPSRQWLESLFEKDQISNAERIALLSGRPANASANTGRIICACFGVGENTLREAIANGAHSVEALGIQLKAGTNCGSCIPELKTLLAKGTVPATA